MSRENVLLRSCQVRNTKHVIGIVVSTGVDTKIQQNCASTVHKTSSLMKDTNKLVGIAFLAMVVVCVICAAMSYVYYQTVVTAEYLQLDADEKVDGISISLEVATVYQFFTFIIIFGNFVPISLYVTLDVVKYIQAQLIMYDLDLYDSTTDTPTQVKSLDLNEELGAVNHVFSDKTGTL